MIATTADNTNNSKYIGALIAVKCAMPEPVSLNRLRNAILVNPVLPDSWAPAVRPPVSLFHDVIKRFTHVSGKKEFKFAPEQCGFTVEEHHNYISMRLVKDKQLATPVVYKVFHTTKSKKAADKEMGAIAIPPAGQDVERDQEFDQFFTTVADLPQDARVHEGVIISLVRTSGTPADDSTGVSTFQIQCEGSPDLMPRYEPFLEAVRASYDELMLQQYGNAQVRELIKEVMRDRLKAAPFLGWHFAIGPKWDVIQELGATLTGVSQGISIVSIPIHKDMESVEPEHRIVYEQVVQSVNEDLLAQAKELEKEILKMVNDPKTKTSTINDRAEKLQALREQISEYRTFAMTIDSVMDDIISDSMDQINDFIKTASPL